MSHHSALLVHHASAWLMTLDGFCWIWNYYWVRRMLRDTKNRRKRKAFKKQPATWRLINVCKQDRTFYVKFKDWTEMRRIDMNPGVWMETYGCLEYVFAICGDGSSKELYGFFQFELEPWLSRSA